MPPRHVQRIPHQGSYAEGAVDDPRHQPGGTEGGAQSPRSSTASRGEDAQCISSSTLSSSVTFAKGSGARILHVGQVTSSGSGEFPAHSRSAPFAQPYETYEASLQQQVDLAMRDLAPR